MTHNEFNLEQAKAGEPVEFFDSTESKWIPVRVIGARRKGTILVEDEHDCITHIAPDYVASALRMAPKKVKVRYRVFTINASDGSVILDILHKDRSMSPEYVEKMPIFREWIHADWQETEITE